MISDEVKIDVMRVDELKLDIVEIGVDGINAAIEWSVEEGYIPPAIRFLEPYSVPFEDPTKPPLTVFKRFQCYEGDTLGLRGVRQTPKNFIFRFAPSENIRRNMKSYRVGAGLKQEWETAELTTNLIKDGRMNGSEFLRSVLQMRRDFLRKGLNVEQLYADAAAGSW